MDFIEDFIKNCINNLFRKTMKISLEGINIDKIAVKFNVYLRELKKWSKTYSLTSIEDEREIVIKHFIDSLLYNYYIPNEKLTIADVGSGAGFPGLPIAITRPKTKVFLIEPSWKKVAFLKQISKLLEIKNVEIIHSKVELLNEKFNIVVSRALWSIGDFVEKCKHIIGNNGFYLISKSIKLEDELRELPSGLKLEIKEFSIPHPYLKESSIVRYLVKIKSEV